MHYIERQIRRCERNVLLGCGGALLGLLLPFFGWPRYFENYLRGAVPLSADELSAVTQAEARARYFVRLRGEQVQDTGFVEVSETRNQYSRELKRREAVGDYLLLHVGERRLLVQAPPGQRSGEWTGGLHSLPPRLRDSVLVPLQERDPATAARLLPVYLDATGFRRPGHLVLAIVLPLLLGVFWRTWRALRRYVDIEQHPLLAKIASYGDPRLVLPHIDEEARAAGGYMAAGLTLVTPSYLIHGSEFHVEIVRFSDIVWAYAAEAPQHLHSPPADREHALCIYEKSGTWLELRLRGRPPRGLLKIIAERSPDAVIGWDDRLAAEWAKPPGRWAALATLLPSR